MLVNTVQHVAARVSFSVRDGQMYVTGAIFRPLPNCNHINTNTKHNTNPKHNP